MRVETWWAFGVVWLAAPPALSLDAPDRERTLQIWYRSSSGCPDGPAFVRRLNELGRGARLAGVGDEVDFVVNVAQQSSHSSGRLERQNERGTIAIREISAERCDEVVEGLAISLDLALDPDSSGPSLSAGARDAGAGWIPSVGIGPTLASAIAPDPMPGGSVHGELLLRDTGTSLIAAARGGMWDSELAAGVDVNISLLSARFAACPVGWQSGPWVLQPCLAVDLGWLGADSPDPEGRSDGSPWVSGIAFARGHWRFTDVWSFYLGAGASVPVVRYELGAETGAALFRTGAVGFDANAGAAWWLP